MAGSPPAQSNPIIVIGEVEAKVQSYLDEKLKELLADAGRNYVTLGVSGGSMTGMLAKILPRIQIDWNRIRLFLVDERIVPIDHPESTMGAYIKALEKTPISADHFVPYIHLVNRNITSVGEWRKEVEESECDEVSDKWGSMDILLLGMGPDGHTASLFPGHPVFLDAERHEQDGRWVAGVEDSPKPPPLRVTLTLPLVNAARNIAFVTTGMSKAPTLKEIMGGSSELPSAKVKCQNGVYWFLDPPAALQLSKQS